VLLAAKKRNPSGVFFRHSRERTTLNIRSCIKKVESNLYGLSKCWGVVTEVVCGVARPFGLLERLRTIPGHPVACERERKVPEGASGGSMVSLGRSYIEGGAAMLLPTPKAGLKLRFSALSLTPLWSVVPFRIQGEMFRLWCAYLFELSHFVWNPSCSWGRPASARFTRRERPFPGWDAVHSTDGVILAVLRDARTPSAAHASFSPFLVSTPAPQRLPF